MLKVQWIERKAKDWHFKLNSKENFIMRYGITKQRGLADWIFIALIVAGCSIVGMVTPAVTKQADTPIEQLAENIIHMETGQTVDFSAQLKKDEQGNVSAQNMKAQTVKPATTNTIVIPSTYSK
jgi:hypothetical protein